MHLEHSQVALPRWYSVAFCVGQDTAPRRERALELERSFQAEIKSRVDRAREEAWQKTHKPKLDEMKKYLSRQLELHKMEPGIERQLVHAATWMITSPTERADVTKVLKRYILQIQELFQLFCGGDDLDNHTMDLNECKLLHLLAGSVV